MPVAASLRRPPLVAAIAERLRAAYRDVAWLPPERRLATELGVSRAALREAIKRLENEGLLESRHGIGVRVINDPGAPLQQVLLRELPAPAARIRQFAAVRVLVEPEIARLAALHATATERRHLAAAQARLAATTDLAEAVRADLDFHRGLARSARNRVLELMLGSIASLEEQARRVTLQRVGLTAAHAQHQRVLDAVIARDPGAAHAAMLDHVRAAQAGAPVNHPASAPSP